MRRMCLRVVWMMALLLPASLLAQELAAIPPLRSPVVDVTGTLDAAQIQQLEQQALALQQRKGAQLQILIVPTTQPEAIEQYTQRVFDQWKIGRKGVDDGVLLLVAKDDRRVRIQPGYGLEGAIPDITANRIIQEYLAPRFREGDYAGGITAATATLAGLIEGEALPAPVSGHAEGGNGAGGGGWIMALFIGFVVAMVARGILGALPRPLRAVLTGVAAGGAALLLTSLLLTSLLLASAGAAMIGLLAGLSSGSPGRFVGGGGWGGGFGGFGGGRGGFGAGGGWGGGGGSSGGGG
ncbi:TPM domain-containing protein, partial [Xanthomonas euvesicatoria]|uniref:TPM domain-containing protein n=1 Tax=Xanthomonas euvesicatoria TaxID=456327 RepID=UPI000F8E7CAD